jgi:hypothetical protein
MASLQQQNNPQLFAQQIKQIAEQKRGEGWSALGVAEYMIAGRAYWLVSLVKFRDLHTKFTACELVARNGEGWFICLPFTTLSEK